MAAKSPPAAPAKRNSPYTVRGEVAGEPASHSPRMTVVEYAAAGDELGPAQGWRLAWWTGVIWSLGVVMWHAWNVPGVISRETFTLEWRGALQLSHYALLALVAAGLLVCLLTGVRGRRLTLVAAIAAIVAVLELPVLLLYRARFWESTTDMMLEPLAHTIWVIGGSAGVLVLLWACLRPESVRPPRIALAAAAVLIIWFVGHALSMAQVLHGTGLTADIIDNLLIPHWLLIHARAVIYLAVGLLILAVITGRFGGVGLLRLTGVAVLVVFLVCSGLEFVVGVRRIDPTPGEISFWMILLLGVGLAQLAPAIALVFWPRRQ